LLADNDALCPMFNRRAFEREVRREIALASRFGTPLSLIFTDLDHFKPVNDIYGHATGDAVLLKVSEILLGLTRDTDIVGRLGGDEFGIVLSQATLADSERKALQLTEQIDALTVRGADDAPDRGLAHRCLLRRGRMAAWRRRPAPHRTGRSGHVCTEGAQEKRAVCPQVRRSPNLKEDSFEIRVTNRKPCA
jgi:diguanylate cyclase (GGDEF)-like protein